MSQLTTNTTTIDELITMANNLPDAGSGGASVETCTVTTSYMDGTLTHVDASTLQTVAKTPTSSGITITVPKYSGVWAVASDTIEPTVSDGIELIYHSGKRALFFVMADNATITF